LNVFADFCSPIELTAKVMVSTERRNCCASNDTNNNILNKQQKKAYLLDIAVPNSHNITQRSNTKINKYLELSVAMRNFWSLEKNSILPLIISATGIVPQSLFKNLKILDLGNTLVVEIQKGILLYSCHIVRKFLNIDTEHNTQQSQNAEARRR
jgi:hypothetical protein